MFRFSIRELMLITLLVAMASGWWVDRRMLAARLDKMDERIAPFEKEFKFIALYRSEFAATFEADREERRRQRLRDSLIPPEIFIPESTAERPLSSSPSSSSR